MKFPIIDFSSQFDQICWKLQIWSHLLKEFLIENFIFFCSVLVDAMQNLEQNERFSNLHKINKQLEREGFSVSNEVFFIATKLHARNPLISFQVTKEKFLNPQNLTLLCTSPTQPSPMGICSVFIVTFEHALTFSMPGYQELVH